MSTAAKATPKDQVLVVVMSGGAQPYFVMGGLPRHSGEVLPREGANMGMMVRASSAGFPRVPTH